MQLGDEHYEIRLARDAADVRAAQRLRYRVFVQEMGASGGEIDVENRLETDRFDEHCQHLILVDNRRAPDQFDHVVGVYRMLDRDGAERAGGFYSQGEYDLAPLIENPRSILELGRSCVHPDHRNGMALYRLWHGLGDYVQSHGIEVLFGVASFSGTEPDENGAPLAYLQKNHLAPADIRVRSLKMATFRGPTDLDRRSVMAAMPALIKAYLRIGGFVGEGAFIDRDFNTIDVCMILDTTRMGPSARQMYGGHG